MMAEALLQYETIDAPQIDAIMEGRDRAAGRLGQVRRTGQGRARSAAGRSAGLRRRPDRRIASAFQKATSSRLAFCC